MILITNKIKLVSSFCSAASLLLVQVVLVYFHPNILEGNGQLYAISHPSDEGVFVVGDYFPGILHDRVSVLHQSAIPQAGPSPSLSSLPGPILLQIQLIESDGAAFVGQPHLAMSTMIGWPFRCIRGVVLFGNLDPQYYPELHSRFGPVHVAADGQRYALHHAIAGKIAPRSRLKDSSIVPLAILPAQLVTNIILYAITIYCTIWITAACVARRRVRRGLCPRCRYPLLGGRCSECGYSTLSRSAASCP